MVGDQDVSEEFDVALAAKAVIDEYGGNAEVAVSELLLECAYLRDQLAAATMLMGHGLTRGWKPSLERPRHG